MRTARHTGPEGLAAHLGLRAAWAAAVSAGGLPSAPLLESWGICVPPSSWRAGPLQGRGAGVDGGGGPGPLSGQASSPGSAGLKRETQGPGRTRRRRCRDRRGQGCLGAARPLRGGACGAASPPAGAVLRMPHVWGQGQSPARRAAAGRPGSLWSAEPFGERAGQGHQGQHGCRPWPGAAAWVTRAAPVPAW